MLKFGGLFRGKTYVKEDITGEVYGKKIGRYVNIGEFVKKRPNIVNGFRDYFEDWVNEDVSLVIEKRSGKKAGPSEMSFMESIECACTDGKKILIPFSYTFPLFAGSSVHERLHFYSIVNDSSAESYNCQKILESGNIIEKGGRLEREFVLDFLKNLSENHFNSLVGHTISELIAYTETEPVLKEAKIPFGIDVKPYFDMDKKLMKDYGNFFENSSEREVLITPESFYKELKDWYQYYIFSGRVNDILIKTIPLVSTLFSQYARIVNGFEDMSPSELWSLEPEDFVESYNKKVKNIKAKARV